MPYCIHCMTEYRPGFTVCIDCGATLTDEFPVTERDEDARQELDAPTLLCSLADGPESDMVISLLTENDIPALRLQQGSGQFLRIYMGMSFQTADIYVPSQALPQAIEMVYPLLPKGDCPSIELETLPPLNEEDDAFGEEVYHGERRRRMKVGLIILLFIPGLIWLLIFFLQRLLVF